MRFSRFRTLSNSSARNRLSLGIRVEVILKLIEYGFGDIVGTGGTQALVQQRHHPMHVRQLGKCSQSIVCRRRTRICSALSGSMWVVAQAKSRSTSTLIPTLPGNDSAEDGVSGRLAIHRISGDRASRETAARNPGRGCQRGPSRTRSNLLAKPALCTWFPTGLDRESRCQRPSRTGREQVRHSHEGDRIRASAPPRPEATVVIAVLDFVPAQLSERQSTATAPGQAAVPGVDRRAVLASRHTAHTDVSGIDDLQRSEPSIAR